MKKIIAFLLAMVMCIGLVPISALAADGSVSAMEEESAAVQESSQEETQTSTDAAGGKTTGSAVSDSKRDGTNVSTATAEYTLETDPDLGERPSGFTAEDSGENPYGIMPVAATASGTLGSLSWSIDGGVLTISGSGEMEDCSYQAQPWYSYRSSITSVVVKSGVTSVGNYAFCQLANVETVTLPTSVKSIGYAAFAECYSLSSIDLGGTETIAAYAFQQVELTGITIPSSVTSISSLAFFMTDIAAYTAEGGTYTSQDGVLYTDNGKTLFAYPQGKPDTSFTVPAGVTKIGDEAFCYVNNLTSISFPTSVTTFGESAFQGIYDMTSFTMPDSVTEVGMFTFYACPSLTNFTFGSGLTSTSYEMLESCTALTTVNFGSTLSELDARTFAYCTGLQTITLPKTITTIGNGCFGECRGLTTFVSEGLVGVIPFQAFLNCTSLNSVILNEGVTEISREVFCGSTSLTAITLPASIEFVYFGTFSDATVVTNKNTKLRSYAGTGYRYLEDVSITGTYNYDMAYQVLDLVNQERAAEGLPALVMDQSLLDTAMQRSSEISILYAHTRPDGSSCFHANSAMLGENIAYGQSSASAVMNAWMNSEGHRANILTNGYTTIGIGCFCINGVYYWAQCFGAGSSTASCTQPANQTVTNTISLAVGEFEEPVLSTGTYWDTPETFSYTYSMSLSSTLGLGDSETAKLFVQGPSGVRTSLNNSGFTFTSSNSKVASVSSEGKVTGLSSGSTVIQASLDFTSISSTLLVAPDGVIKVDGTWYYYVNGVLQSSYTGVANKANAAGWWYIKNGKVDFTYTGVAKNNNGWWYVKNGKVDFAYEGFAQNSNGTWYCKNGKVDFSVNDVLQDKTGAIGEKGTWYYVVGSKVQTGYTGVANYANKNGWWYIRNGKVDFSANTVAKNKNGWWYVTGGKVQFGYTGLANYSNANGWWYIKNGKVDFTYTGLASNKNGWYYLSGGKVQFGYTGFAQNSNGKWYVKNGHIDFKTTGTYKDTTGAIGAKGTSYKVVNSKVQ